jgi:4-hydroxy-4-methyl-2-oxoglutarate aldolase
LTRDDVGRFTTVYTGAIADILDEMGEGPFALPSRLAPLRPGMRVAGFAFPVVGQPASGLDYERSIRRVLTMLGEVGDGHVVVYESHDDRSAHLGELSATALKVRGCAGAVVDGGVRDVRYLLETGLPVWSRYVTPVDCIPRWQLLEWKGSCRVGDVTIALGDVVVGDEDGLVRIRAEVADQVLDRCLALVDTENAVRAAVRAGTPPLEAYDRFGKF